MRIYRSTPLLVASLGIALLTGAASSHAAIGARVLVQEWSPLAPSEQRVRVLANDPSAVSDAVQKAWSEARPRLCTALRNAMGKGGVVAGQTLHEITCRLDENVTLAVASAGANALTATLAVSGYVEASSTTPTILGKDADPRVSVALTGRMLLALTVQPNPDQTLRVDKAQFRLSDATLDSHNLTGDVLKWVAEDLIPYFKGPDFRRLAESAIDDIGIDLGGRFNAALAPVNARLRTPSGLVRVAVWGKPDAIVVAFGPREIAPPAGGTMWGALRWNPSTVIAPGSCDSFRIDASVQTGPAPLRDPGGYYEPGDAPRRNVGTFQMLPSSAAGECRYRLTGIAAGWPNALAARSSIGAGKSAGNSVHSTHYAVVGDGWDGRSVVPQPSAERNYAVRASLEGSATIDPAATLKQGRANPLDPRTSATDRVTTGAVASRSPTVQPGTTKATVTSIGKAPSSFASDRVPSGRGDAVSLNPQPLPPDPPDATRPVLRWDAARPGGR